MADYPEFIDESIETMPRGDIAVLQEARLNWMVNYAYANAPLIRETWDASGVKPADVRSLADFAGKAPFIDKDAVRKFRDANKDPCGGLKAVRNEELRVVGSTSGTTGDPTPVLLGPRFPNQVSFQRELWHMGMRPGDYLVRAVFTFRGSLRPGFNDGGFVPLQFSHTPQEVPRIFEAALRFRPTGLMPMSSPMLLWMEAEIERTGADPQDIFKSFHGATFGGEALGARQKALAQSWGLNLFELGGIGDVTTGAECRIHDGLHIWEDLVFAECLDPNGDEPVRDGEIGELVVTALTDRFNPLIRYRTDDLVRIDRTPCLCGRTHSRMHVAGRKSDRLIIGGRAVMPRDVQVIIEKHAATRAGLFQFVRPDPNMDYLWLRVGYNPEQLSVSPQKLEADLHEMIRAVFDTELKIELTLDSELLKLGPPHKIPRVTKS